MYFSLTHKKLVIEKFEQILLILFIKHLTLEVLAISFQKFTFNINFEVNSLIEVIM